MYRIAFTTLGCKVNQYETAVLEGQFAAHGFLVVPEDSEADVYVINSCTVTATADQKSRQAVHKLRRAHPAAVIVLTGCYAQAFTASASIPEADIITGTRDRLQLLPLVERFLSDHERIVAVIPHDRDEPFEPMQADRFPERTRAFVKIQDGCEQYCAYCAIPYARGFLRSKPLNVLVSELTALSAAGHSEIVLSGINLPCYGKELGLRLIDAAEAACSVDGVRRVRLGSLEPERLSEEDVARMAAQPKLCDQFHLSLQSGCDATLKRMNRHYTAAEYAAQADLLRKYFPNAALTTDLMVGFPGETDEEFAQSLAFVRSVGFAKVHVFPYSRRPGTRADRFPEQLSRAIKTQRSKTMNAAVTLERERFLQTQVGRVEDVLFETLEQGCWQGYTTNYTPVFLPDSGCDLQGKILPVRLTAVSADGVAGLLA